MMSQATPAGRRLVVNERHRYCLRPSSARPTDGFLCQRSCLSILSRGTWTQFKYYLITSLRPERLVAETWGMAEAQLMDSFSRGRARGVIMHAYYARVASSFEMRLGNTTSMCEKNLSDVAVCAFAMFITLMSRTWLLKHQENVMWFIKKL